MNRIMQKFRPIAPKPIPPGSETAEPVPCVRTKRRYVKKKPIEECGRRDSLVGKSCRNRKEGYSAEKHPPKSDYHTRTAVDLVQNRSTRRVVNSWLVVDNLKETFPGGGLSCWSEEEEEEEKDACPELVSDEEQRVKSTNLAYMKMVGFKYEEGRPPLEMRVQIVLKEMIPETWAMFTCRVKVEYYRFGEDQENHLLHHITMHCDVLKMDFGGFTWRLDAQSALRLGPSPQSLEKASTRGRSSFQTSKK